MPRCRSPLGRDPFSSDLSLSAHLGRHSLDVQSQNMSSTGALIAGNALRCLSELSASPSANFSDSCHVRALARRFCAERLFEAFLVNPLCGNAAPWGSWLQFDWKELSGMCEDLPTTDRAKLSKVDVSARSRIAVKRSWQHDNPDNASKLAAPMSRLADIPTFLLIFGRTRWLFSGPYEGV